MVKFTPSTLFFNKKDSFAPSFSPKMNCWDNTQHVFSLPFAWCNSLLRFYSPFPLIQQNVFFDSTEFFLRFYWNIEPSTFTRRRFGIATPKARQVDGEPSATSWIQRNASVNPNKRLWQSSEAFGLRRAKGSVNPRKHLRKFKKMQSLW